MALLPTTSGTSSFSVVLPDEHATHRLAVPGAPDWREDMPGRPMSDQEVSDVVAWLASRRAASPGQPYPDSKNAQYQEHHDVD